MSASLPLDEGESSFINLISGEEIQLKAYCTLIHSRYGPALGTLYITNFRLSFKEHDGGSLVKVMRGTVHDKIPFHYVPVSTIFRVDKSSSKHEKTIELHCKDFRVVKFSFVPDTTTCEKVDMLIRKLSFPKTMEHMFAFYYTDEAADMYQGWSVYNPAKEYERLGIPDATWRLSTANNEYSICPSYPSVLVVPTAISDSQLTDAATFRTRGRIPVLSWRHPTTGAALTRSSQPRVGWGRTRCPADEALISYIRLANPAKPNTPIKVLDARPRLDAAANQALGAGSEGVHYAHTEVEFLGIPNSLRMQDSGNRLRDLINSMGALQWHEGLANTRWLEYITLIISSAVRITTHLQRGYSVLVHCSDGWDRTSQLVSLTTLLLDPYYRTIRGFIILIEKEWLAFGHKFSERTGHASSDYTNRERSPVFLQWIDCVWQITNQFPLAFEFNENFLVTLLDNLYSCKYGNFLYDNERTRKRAALKERTVSLWSEIDQHRDKYTNLYYNPTAGLILPVAEIQHIRLWEGYYLRWAVPYRSQEITDHNSNILAQLRKEVEIEKQVSGSQIRIYDLKKQLESSERDKVFLRSQLTAHEQKCEQLVDMIKSSGNAMLAEQMQKYLEKVDTQNENMNKIAAANADANDQLRRQRDEIILENMRLKENIEQLQRTIEKEKDASRELLRSKIALQDKILEVEREGFFIKDSVGIEYDSTEDKEMSTSPPVNYVNQEVTIDNKDIDFSAITSPIFPCQLGNTDVNLFLDYTAAHREIYQRIGSEDNLFLLGNSIENCAGKIEESSNNGMLTLSLVYNNNNLLNNNMLHLNTTITPTEVALSNALLANSHRRKTSTDNTHVNINANLNPNTNINANNGQLTTISPAYRRKSSDNVTPTATATTQPQQHNNEHGNLSSSDGVVITRKQSADNIVILNNYSRSDNNNSNNSSNSNSALSPSNSYTFNHNNQPNNNNPNSSANNSANNSPRPSHITTHSSSSTNGTTSVPNSPPLNNNNHHHNNNNKPNHSHSYDSIHHNNHNNNHNHHNHNHSASFNNMYNHTNGNHSNHNSPNTQHHSNHNSPHNNHAKQQPQPQLQQHQQQPATHSPTHFFKQHNNNGQHNNYVYNANAHNLLTSSTTASVVHPSKLHPHLNTEDPLRSSTSSIKQCAGCDGLLRKGQGMMVRVAGQMKPHCDLCAHTFLKLTQRIGVCFSCGAALDNIKSSVIDGEPHCEPCIVKLQDRMNNLGFDWW